ncbi:MAG: leucyl/phenylalanyl-tRNA--protein transferase [Phycisphaeraceae bacterium]
MPTTQSQLTPVQVLRAYCLGAFPMAHGRRGAIEWFSPDPRALLPLEPGRFHVPKSLARRVRSGRFHVTHDQAFERVIRACAGPRPGEPDTWINDEIIRVYTELHHMGLAHSVEAWTSPTEQTDETLAGGLYGVALGGAFFGESMFSRRTDASKVCLVKLVEHLRQRGFALLDVQFHNPHLAQFNLYELPHRDYLERLQAALAMPVRW